MDGTAAISSNLEALKRILAGLVAMAGLGNGSPAIASRQSGPAQAADGPTDCLVPTADCRLTLPRHLYRAILRLLRPAEAAARRLIIASSRGLVVVLPPAGKPRPKPATMEPQLRRLGIAVVVSPADLARGASILRRLRGRGTGVLPLASPRTGSGDGRGGEPRPSPVRAPRFPLFDPPRRIPRHGNRRTVPAHAAPRILFPGVIKPYSLPPPPSPDDPVDATRLGQRLAALAAALDDLPGQAKRFARWRARHDIRRKGPAPGRFRRMSPLRSGRPTGGRLARFDPSAIRRRNIREVDEILAHAHALAQYALQNPDTS